MYQRQLLDTLPLAKGADVHNRIAKLALYKECIALALRVDDAKVRTRTLNEVRERWCEHRGAGGHALQLALASCLDRLAYGRLCVPKARLRLLPRASERYDWGVVCAAGNDDNGGTAATTTATATAATPLTNATATRHCRRDERQSPDAFEHGRGGGRSFVPVSNWGMNNIDPDVVTRHKELVDRQHFMGPHWRNRAKPMQLDKLSFEEQLHVHFQPVPHMRKTPKKHY